MQGRNYASYVEWYTEGPFADYVRAAGMAGNAMTVIEATQPAGDMSDPPIDELILIRLLTSDCPCEVDLGPGHFSTELRRDDFFLVSPNTRSSFQMRAPHAVDIFGLPAKNWLGILGKSDGTPLDFGRLHTGTFRSGLLSAMCQRLVEAARAPQEASRLFVDSASMAVLGELVFLSGCDHKTLRRPDVRDWRVRRTLEQIDARLGEDISLAELAGTVDLSPSHYSALFRAATGVTPHAWIMRRRIEKACELLADPRTPITEVALSTGFSSSQHFATAFRAEMGTTPTIWRRERAV